MRIVALLFLLMSLFVASPEVRAERRVALVVGNASYLHAVRLNNPANDARDVTERLKRLGFEVVTAVDATVEKFDAAVAAFERQLTGADLALFFYAGHGLQFDGVNYLIPVDGRLDNEGALKRRAVTAQEVIDKMERAAKANLIILDACRNNNLLRDLEQALPERNRNAASQRGLARMEPRGINTLIAFATAPNDVAADGAGRNSPFTTALVKHIEVPNVSVQDMLTSVAADVLRDTNQKQRPEVLSRLSMRVVLNPKIEPAVAPAIPTPVNPPPSSEREASIAWEAAKNTCARGELTAFAKRYNNTFFGDLAKSRLADIEGGRTCLSATPQPVAPAAPTPAPPRPIDDDGFVRSLQSELKRVGCYDGSVDGNWGSGSRSAFGAFLRHAKIAGASEPSRDHLTKAQEWKGRACPITCGDDEELVVDVCKTKPAAKAPAAAPKATTQQKVDPNRGARGSDGAEVANPTPSSCSQARTACIAPCLKIVATCTANCPRNACIRKCEHQWTRCHAAYVSKR